MSQQGPISTIGGGGGAVSGNVIQKVKTSTNAYISTTSIIPFDDTIPQITEGAFLFSLVITPSNASNILEFEFSGFGGCSAIRTMVFSLFEGVGPNAIYTTVDTSGSFFTVMPAWNFSKVAGAVTPLTYTVRWGLNAGPAVELNGITGRKYGGTGEVNFTIKERLP